MRTFSVEWIDGLVVCFFGWDSLCLTGISLYLVMLFFSLPRSNISAWFFCDDLIGWISFWSVSDFGLRQEWLSSQSINQSIDYSWMQSSRKFVNQSIDRSNIDTAKAHVQYVHFLPLKFFFRRKKIWKCKHLRFVLWYLHIGKKHVGSILSCYCCCCCRLEQTCHSSRTKNLTFSSKSCWSVTRESARRASCSDSRVGIMSSDRAAQSASISPWRRSWSTKSGSKYGEGFSLPFSTLCCSKNVFSWVFLFFATIQLQIWDTAGQERFRTITQSYYRSANGVIVAYDITKRETFLNVNHWCEDVLRYAGPGVSQVLVGTPENFSPKFFSFTIFFLVQDKVETVASRTGKNAHRKESASRVCAPRLATGTPLGALPCIRFSHSTRWHSFS